jgi:hypothetical protein
MRKKPSEQSQQTAPNRGRASDGDFIQKNRPFETKTVRKSELENRPRCRFHSATHLFRLSYTTGRTLVQVSSLSGTEGPAANKVENSQAGEVWRAKPWPGH